MYPELIRIGDFSISSFGAMMALCFLAGYWLITVEARRKKLDQAVVGNLFLAAMFGGIVGAKLLYVFENVPLSEILANPGANLLSRGGLTFYGGFFGALFLVWLIARRNKISMWTVGDLASPSLALAYAIGRLGCFLVGDDYGVPSDVPWAIAFPKGLPPTDIPVHPTQLYEIGLILIVFAIIWKLRTRLKPAGWLFSIYLILAGFERFFIEFLRSTTPSPIPGLSVAQLMAVAIIIVGAVKLYSLRTAGDNIPAPESPRKEPGRKKRARA